MSSVQESYGDAIWHLAQGLDLAQTRGWVTEGEARKEFRSNVRSLKTADDAASLRTQADQLERGVERQ